MRSTHTSRAGSSGTASRGRRASLGRLGLAPPLALTLLLPLWAGGAGAATTVPLSIHVEQREGASPAAAAAWIEAQIARAGTLYAVAGAAFTRRPDTPLRLSTDGIERTEQRHALAEHAAPDGAIHVFVVRRLADKDRVGGWIGGVHWRYAGRRRPWRGRRYIILSRELALPDTLAHELGHWFGLPHHPKDPDNLMFSPGRTADARLAAWQLRRIRQRLRPARRRGAPRR